MRRHLGHPRRREGEIRAEEEKEPHTRRHRWDLLKALKERRYVDEKVLLCQKADFVDLANDLLDKGFIIMSSTPCDGKWNTGYAISQLGLDAIESRSKKDFLEFWKATCSGITSGVVEALPR